MNMVNATITPKEAAVQKLSEQFKVLNITRGAQKSRLLLLPPEVRNIIFRQVLYSRPRWTLRHVVRCPHRGIDRFKPETPPFMLDRADHGSILNHRTGAEPKFWSPTPKSRECRCSVRQGFSLLLASRQCYAEGAPVFYDNNTFCFDSVPQMFGYLSRLNPDLLALIGHISIMGLAYDFKYDAQNRYTFSNYWTAGNYEPKDTQAWSLLYDGVRNLKTLEMRVESAFRCENAIRKIWRRFPQCCISLVQLGAVSVTEGLYTNHTLPYRSLGSFLAHNGQFVITRSFADPETAYNVPFIYIKLSRILDKPKSKNDQIIDWEWREWILTMNRCQIAAHNLFANTSGNVCATALRKYDCERNRVRLDTIVGTETITVYGLPLAKYTRHMRQTDRGTKQSQIRVEVQDNDADREEYFYNLSQNSAGSSRKARRRSSSQEEKRVRDASPQPTPEEKEANRVARLDMEAERERKETSKQRGKLNRKVKRQQESQRKERKRVQS